MSGIPYSRRRVLQALGAIPLTLPVLPWERLVHAGPPETPPKRLVLVMQNNGTQQANFWPDANLRSPILDSLFLDPKTGMDNGLKAKTNLIKGVYIPNDANGTNANQHDMGFARLFTGHKLISAGGQPWGGGPSVDQILAQKWKEDSLTLAVLASQGLEKITVHALPRVAVLSTGDELVAPGTGPRDKRHGATPCERVYD